MVVATYIVRTLAVKGRNGYGHAKHVLANGRQLGCGFVSLQETSRAGKTEFFAAGYRDSALGKKRMSGKDCMELVWQLGKRFAVSPFRPTS